MPYPMFTMQQAELTPGHSTNDRYLDTVSAMNASSYQRRHILPERHMCQAKKIAVRWNDCTCNQCRQAQILDRDWTLRLGGKLSSRA